ncbi:hypothetical protein JOB18_028391 [Solea senegalensis]|uniref:Uncharacterized protein n=1 Tax=Solea senegalensis TaxID=28829 RepID=A0AAV6T7Z9_SOLSE|nr:hypothetical protein JOB18_028391 [Solea senegalensis]
MRFDSVEIFTTGKRRILFHQVYAMPKPGAKKCLRGLGIDWECFGCLVFPEHCFSKCGPVTLKYGRGECILCAVTKSMYIFVHVLFRFTQCVSVNACVVYCVCPTRKIKRELNGISRLFILSSSTVITAANICAHVCKFTLILHRHRHPRTPFWLLKRGRNVPQ